MNEMKKTNRYTKRRTTTRNEKMVKTGVQGDATKPVRYRYGRC